jgi:hypothetical protein
MNEDYELDTSIVHMLIENNKRMRRAGCALAEAAMYTIREYDGLHRLALATADWSEAIADEGGRGDRYERDDSHLNGEWIMNDDARNPVDRRVVLDPTQAPTVPVEDIKSAVYHTRDMRELAKDDVILEDDEEASLKLYHELIADGLSDSEARGTAWPDNRVRRSS